MTFEEIEIEIGRRVDIETARLRAEVEWLRGTTGHTQDCPKAEAVVRAIEGCVMPDLPARLARKWCQACVNERLNHWPTGSHSHEAIAAAIREALEEAENRLRTRVTELSAYKLARNTYVPAMPSLPTGSRRDPSP